MRRWLLDLHLYLGLACLPYSIVFGVSSLLLNHEIERSERSHWEQRVASPLPATDDYARANALRDALDLRGGVLAHTVRRGAGGELEFKLIAPGRVYEFALGADDVARVDETDGGVIGVVRELHGRGGLEASAWGPSWALYTELTTFALMFAIGSGLWLFWPRRGKRWLGVGATALGLAAVAFAAVGIW